MAILPKGGGGKPEEEKTVTAGTSVIEVLPSSGKTMKKVKVNPTPSQSKTVTPSTSQQTVSPDAGKLLSQVIVNAMASGALSDITVSSAGLITAQVGTSGYLASGTKKTKQLTTQAAKTWTPTTSDQSIASGRYLTGKQTIKGDSNLIAENIRDGISLFGVLGTMVEGIDLLSIFGYTKISVDKVTYASTTSLQNLTLSHSLGESPKCFMILGGIITTNGSLRHYIHQSKYADNSIINDTYCFYNNNTMITGGYKCVSSKSSDSIVFLNVATAGNLKFIAGEEYTLITMS